MIALLTIFFFCFRALSWATYCDFTFNDRFLPNKQFHSFSASDWLQCVEACHADSSCISYNYEDHNIESCHLNNCGFRDRCEAFENVVVSTGAIFHQLKQVLVIISLCTVELPLTDNSRRSRTPLEADTWSCSQLHTNNTFLTSQKRTPLLRTVPPNTKVLLRGL